MKRLLVVVVLMTSMRAVLVGAQPEAVVVAVAPGSDRVEALPVQAKVGEAVDLSVRLVAGRRLSPLPDGSRVRWLQVVPRMQHRDPPARNGGNRIFSNSIMFGPSHGRWLGHDTLEYDTVELKTRPGVEIRGEVVRLSKAHQSRFGGLGTIWIAAEATWDHEGRDVAVRTPDGAAVDALGLVPRVMRVSFRGDDSFVGWLGTFFHVPYVFGSTGPQTDRYTGTDCADAMVGARRAAGSRALPYTSVTGLTELARSLSPVLHVDDQGNVKGADGAPVVIRWGDSLRPGDMLAMDFTSDTAVDMLPRAWDHVAALVEDAGRGEAREGVLDGTDVVRHMTTHGLMDEPLASMGPIRFRLWRWRR